MKAFFLIALAAVLFTGFRPSARPGKGDVAMNIELKSPTGKTVKLSSLKGKMVLIDFWASWCGPCRKENPNVVEAYNKYRKAKFKNGKGFEIFSVSLDKSTEPWIAAIEKDGLIWKNHGFDAGGKIAQEYGVNSIPTAFLIDGDQKVIASGDEIRGLKLHVTLDGQLK